MRIAILDDAPSTVGNWHRTAKISGNVMHTIATRKARARRVVVELKAVYGSPRLNNKDDPLDELFFILLSQMTTAPSYERVYAKLKASLPTWNQVLAIKSEELVELIAGAGLSSQKGPRMKEIAQRLREDFGQVSLVALVHQENERVLRYLTSLPGVGTKTAKCVMMYGFGRDVLPVDTHTARVAYRLGLVSTSQPAKIEREIDDVVTAPLRYDFHVNAVAHGRVVCRSLNPRCSKCVIRSICQMKHSARYLHPNTKTMLRHG